MSDDTVSAPTLAARVQVRPSRGPTRAVAVVLPGGRADSFAPGNPRQLAGRRMLPFARGLSEHPAADGVAVWTVGYRYRGWNGEQMSPVHDTRWALDEVRREHGDVPVVLVGHSMGGRTAIRVADDASVVGVVALAPWVPDGEPVEQLRGRRLLVAHGSLDRVTSPASSRRLVEAATVLTRDAAYVVVRRDAHPMLLRWPTWHRLATNCVLDFLGVRQLPAAVAAAIARGYV